jgi:hypothetical protein
MVGWGCVEAKPIAQASVLRWVLMGGISADSGRVVSFPRSVRMSCHFCGGVLWNGAGGGLSGFRVWHTVGS